MPDVREITFGKVAIALGYLRQEQLDICFNIQRERREHSLDTIMIRHGFLTEEQKKNIQQEIDGKSTGKPGNTTMEDSRDPSSLIAMEGNIQNILMNAFANNEGHTLVESVFSEPLSQQTQNISCQKKNIAANMQETQDITGIIASGFSQKTLGRYELLEEIGQGGMGKVYKAHDPQLNRIVALKILLSGELASKEQIQRFLREAQAMAQLRHGNIVTIYDMGCENNVLYFTMDFIDGYSLKDYSRNSRLDYHQIADIVAKIADAIEYSHQRNIIHRDLKPANIMMDEDNQPLVMDFGLVKMMEDSGQLSRSGIIMGTLQYMPPEQIKGKVDNRTDIYALGVILYQLITGKLPYQVEDTMEIIEHILHYDVLPPEMVKTSVPKGLADICKKAMVKDKESRYQNARDMAADLRSYNQGLPIQPMYIPGLPQNRQAKTITQPKMSKIVCGVVLLGIFLWFAFFDNKHDDKMLSIQAQLIDTNEEIRTRFRVGEEIKIKIDWQAKDNNRKEKILFYGKNVESFVKEWRGTSPQRKLIIPLKTRERKSGNFKVVVQVVIDDVIREKRIQFTIEEMPKVTSEIKEKPEKERNRGGQDRFRRPPPRDRKRKEKIDNQNK